MDRDAINNGYEFEDYIAKLFDGKKQPGSGNQWHSKSDITAHGLLISAKAEKGITWARIRSQLKEAIDFAQGTGNIPMLALEDKSDGEQIGIIRLSDLANILSDGISIPANSGMSKGELKRIEADIPQLLRK